MYHSFLIHSSADGHLGCFHVLTIINSAAIKLLEENIGKTLSNINHSRILYDPPPRILEIKAKINKLDLIKIKSFCTRKETISSVQSLSCVRLFATPWTAAYQVSLSMGFSRQEHWSGLTFPSPKDLYIENYKILVKEIKRKFIE